MNLLKHQHIHQVEFYNCALVYFQYVSKILETGGPIKKLNIINKSMNVNFGYITLTQLIKVVISKASEILTMQKSVIFEKLDDWTILCAV